MIHSPSRHELEKEMNCLSRQTGRQETNDQKQNKSHKDENKLAQKEQIHYHDDDGGG